nr:integrase, catalytic region, zinc finger, CCHC-type, peptidase aspartic, catalytic [Tanacetum cinerariifolium]
MTGNRALLTNFVEKFLGTVRFSNNDFAVIAGYEDVVIGSMTIKKVYYVEGLGHNLFCVGQQYVLVVVDDYSRYTWVFFLHSKDEASEVIISFIKKTQVNLQLQVQRVRTDNGTEFKNKTLAQFIDEDVGKLKAKGDIGVFVGYSKESAVFRIYNKRTLKIHKSVNVNFDEISEMASKQFTSKKDLEDLFHDFYDEYFDSSKIMKSLTTNVETPINEEVFHEVSESFQGESSSASLNDDMQQSPEEVILPSSNTQLIPINMVPNDDEASTSHNVSNE